MEFLNGDTSNWQKLLADCEDDEVKDFMEKVEDWAILVEVDFNEDRSVPFDELALSCVTAVWHPADDEAARAILKRAYLLMISAGWVYMQPEHHRDNELPDSILRTV